MGCSNGGGNTLKTLPIFTYDPTAGQCETCQDSPNAFGGAVCQTGISIYFCYVP